MTIKHIAIIGALFGALLIPSSAQTWGVVGLSSGSGGGGATFCSTCTGSSGSPSLCWEVATDTTDIETDGGCVVSGGDHTGDASSLVDIAAAPSGKTGYAIYWPAGGDYYAFDISGDDILLDSAGTITFDLNVHTFVEGSGVVRFSGAMNTDDCWIELYGVSAGPELRIRYEGNNTGIVSAATDGANLSADTWYSVTAKWRIGSSNPCLYINVNSTTGQTDTDLTEFTTPAAYLRLGECMYEASSGYIKNIKIYKEWIE